MLLPAAPAPRPGAASFGGFGSVTPTAGGALDASLPLLHPAGGGAASLGGVAPAQLLRYEVVVVTSDVRGAGTDGGVWVLLEGTLGSSGWTRLEGGPGNVSGGLECSLGGWADWLCWSGLAAKAVLVCRAHHLAQPSRAHRNLSPHPFVLSSTCPPTAQFDRGCRDVFSLLAPNLGVLTEVGVRKEPPLPQGGAERGGSGGGGGGTDWHLHSVEVMHPGECWNNCSVAFIMVGLLVGFGSALSVPVFLLPQPSPAQHPTRPKAKPTHPPTPNNPPGLQRRFSFPWGRWLRGATAEAVLTCSDLLPTAGTIGGQTARPADVSSAPRGLPLIGSPGVAGLLGGVGSPPPLPPFLLRSSPGAVAGTGVVPGGGGLQSVTPSYRVTVVTSDVDEGGTDEDVVLVIYGEAGNTGELRLEGGPGDFERGKVGGREREGRGGKRCSCPARLVDLECCPVNCPLC